MTDAAIIQMPDRSTDSIVGGNVKYLMDDRDVEQGTLAGILGVDQSTLSLKLHGKRKWTVTELVKVSDTFNVSIDALARRRELAPIPGGGSTLHGVDPLFRLRAVGLTGLEPVTPTVKLHRFADDHMAEILPLRRVS